MNWMEKGPLLHVGCGHERLEGWVNIDFKALPGVDHVADVTKELGFTGARAIFAEHFLEHLRMDGVLQFLLNAHAALDKRGWIRMSTPNVEWTLATHYSRAQEPKGKIDDVLMLNRAFHGWGHQFLWNREALELVLKATGFRSIRWCSYGKSKLKFFRGLERHDTWKDSVELPHVLIVEARKGKLDLKALATARDLIWNELLRHYLDPEVEKPTFGGRLPTA